MGINDEVREAENKVIALKWLAANPTFVGSSAATAEITAFLNKHNLEISHDALSAAFKHLREKGFDFIKAAENDRVAESLSHLPPVPASWPKLETLADIRALSAVRFKQLYDGPNGDKFKARLEAISKAGK
jgi:hypothetical protein